MSDLSATTAIAVPSSGKYSSTYCNPSAEISYKKLGIPY